MTTILAVDGDAALLEIYASALDSHQVLGSVNGKLAHEYLMVGPADLVLLDLMLPDMDGLVLLDEIHTSHPDLPVIVVSGRDDDVDRALCIQLGARKFMAKPFDLTELEGTIAAVLADVAS